MNIDPNTSIGEIVRTNYRTSELFENLQIDFCCRGDKTLASACAELDINVMDLINEVESILKVGDWDSSYLDSLSPSELCDYIVKRHHGYLNESIPLIRQRMRKIADAHGHQHPELTEVESQFRISSENLLVHMKKEELLLFPFIKNLVRARKRGYKIPLQMKELRKQVEMLMEEHHLEGERFARISEITAIYTVPRGACNTYAVTYHSLKEFEKDLHRHVHLENNLLFPKFLKIAEEMDRKR
jgi:regulator of cell morphogenesis and NO signaling